MGRGPYPRRWPKRKRKHRKGQHMADLASLEATVNSTVQRVQADLARLRQQTAQAQSKSSLSADDQARLDRIEQTIKALDPTDPTTLDASATDTSSTPDDGSSTPPTSSAPSTPTI